MTVLTAITTCRIVAWWDKFDAPSNEVFGFEPVRYHTDGTVTPANGTDATEANVEGLAVIESDRVGQAVTVIRGGLVDVGDVLGDIAIGTPIYLADTDGSLSDGAGDSTVDVIIGRVVAAWGSATTDKLLLIKKGG